MDISIDFGDLMNGNQCVTPVFGRFLAEIAVFCFNDMGHEDGVVLNIDGDYNKQCIVRWNIPIATNADRCYGDPIEVTEHAATAVAILLIQKLSPLVVIKRAFRTTGIDYWLGNINGENDDNFLKGGRLEISGIRIGNEATIRQRVNQKIDQVKKSDKTSLPVFIIVTEFSNPRSRVIQR